MLLENILWVRTMNNYRLYFIVIALVVSGMSYLATNDLYVLIGVSLAFLVYPQIALVNRLEKSSKSYTRYKECFHFVNSFLVSLQIKGSIASAFESVNSSMSKEYQQIYEGIRDFSEEEKINYLIKFFPFHFYSLFIKIITLWQEQGGDILSMSSHLLEEGRKNAEYLSFCHVQAMAKIVEFVILWIFTLLILVIMRFSLSQFFSLLTGKVLYKVGIGVFFLFLLVCVDVAVRKISQYEIKGWEEYE